MRRRSHAAHRHDADLLDGDLSGRREISDADVTDVIDWVKGILGAWLYPRLVRQGRVAKATNVAQLFWAKTSWGLVGSLESRTCTASGVVATSTHAPPSLPL